MAEGKNLGINSDSDSPVGKLEQLSTGNRKGMQGEASVDCKKAIDQTLGEDGESQIKDSNGKESLDGTLAEESEMDPKPAEPESKGTYRWEERFSKAEKLGQGSMGIVYRAWDKKLQRSVAVKVMILDQALQADAYRRFQREASAMARLSHPSIISVYDAEIEGDRTWIVMEYVQGRSLAQLFEQGRYQLDQILMLLEKAARGVHHAHLQGIVHRDLKPGNILVTDQGEPKIADFGIAFFSDQESELTKAGSVLGTPAYMAPEQALGKTAEIDARTDVYALGGIMYRLLAGRPPHVGFNISMMVAGIVDRDPIVPRKLNDRVGKDLEAICLKAMEKEPKRRYQTAEEFAEDLRRYRQNEPIVARPATLIYRTIKLLRRRKLLFSVISTSVMAVLLSLGFGIYNWLGAAEQARIARVFGQKVESIDGIMERAIMLPIHDLAPEKKEVRALMRDIEASMTKAGDIAEPSGNYALGRGHFALGEFREARERLEMAWQLGLHEPETAYALGQVLGELYQIERSEVDTLHDPSLRERRLEELNQKYRAPALKYLQLSQQGELLASEYVEALIAFYQKNKDEALEYAKKSIESKPWHYPSYVLVGDIYHDTLKEISLGSVCPNCEDVYKKSKEAYLKALKIGRNSPRAWASLCHLERYWNLLYLLESEGKSPSARLKYLDRICGNVLKADSEFVDGYYPVAMYDAAVANYIISYEFNTAKADPYWNKALTLADQYYRVAKDALDEDNIMFIIYYLYNISNVSGGIFNKDTIGSFHHQVEVFLKRYPSNIAALVFKALHLGFVDLTHEIQKGNDPQSTYQESIKFFQKALEIDPSDIRIPYCLEQANYQFAKYLSSIGKDPILIESAYQDLMDRSDSAFTKPLFAELILVSADFAMDYGKPSIDHLQQALQYLHKPENDQPHFALPLEPMIWGDYYSLMAIHRWLFEAKDPAGYLDEADKFYQQYGLINSNNKLGHLGTAKGYFLEAEYKLGRHQNPRGDLSKARQSVNQALVGRLDVPEFFHRTQADALCLSARIDMLEGWILSKQGIRADDLWDSSINALKKADQWLPGNAITYLHMAEWNWLRAKGRDATPLERSQWIEQGLQFVEKSLDIRKEWPKAITLQAALLFSKEKGTGESSIRAAIKQQAEHLYNKSFEMFPQWIRYMDGVFGIKQ